jgi:hypothetical protein
MLDTVVAMPDVVVAIATAKKLTEKGLPVNTPLVYSIVLLTSCLYKSEYSIYILFSLIESS